MEFKTEDWQFIFSCLYAKEYDKDNLRSKKQIDKNLYYRKIFFTLNKIDSEINNYIPNSAQKELIKILTPNVTAVKIDEHLIIDGLTTAISRQEIPLTGNEEGFIQLLSLSEDDKNKNNLIKYVYDKDENLLEKLQSQSIKSDCIETYNFIGRLLQITAKKQKKEVSIPQFMLDKIEQDKINLFFRVEHNWDLIDPFLKGLTYCNKENQLHFIEHHDDKFKKYPDYQAWKSKLNIQESNKDDKFSVRESISMQKTLQFSLLSVFLNSDDPVIKSKKFPKMENVHAFNAFISKAFIYLTKHLNPNITSNEFFENKPKSSVESEKKYTIKFNIETNISFDELQELNNRANTEIENLKENINFLKKSFKEVPNFKDLLLSEIEQNHSDGKVISGKMIETLYKLAEAHYARENIVKIMESQGNCNKQNDETSSNAFKI